MRNYEYTEENSMIGMTKISTKKDVSTNFTYVINVQYAVRIIVRHFILDRTNVVKILLPFL